MDIKLQQQLLCSTSNINMKAKIYGNSNVTYISTLQIIYELLEGCIDISHDCVIKLKELADHIILKDENICHVRGVSSFNSFLNENLITPAVVLNNPPTVDSWNLNFDTELLTHTFSPEEFKLNFTDPDGDLPETVRIVTLPIIGTLKYNGELIQPGFLFNINNASNLEYTRGNSIYDDTFIFQTSDNNQTNKLFSNMANFNIEVGAAINQPPAEVGDGSATTGYAQNITFTRAMFTTATTPPYSDPEGDAAAILKILTLPAQGTLLLNGVSVVVNQEIPFSSIDSGLLVFAPDAGIQTAYTPSFQFSIADAGSGQFVS